MGNLMMNKVLKITLFLYCVLCLSGCKTADESYVLSGITFNYSGVEHHDKGDFNYISYTLNGESKGTCIQIESEELGLANIVIDVPDITRTAENYKSFLGSYSSKMKNVWCRIYPGNNYVYTDSCNLTVDFLSDERITGTFNLFKGNAIIIYGTYDVPRHYYNLEELPF